MTAQENRDVGPRMNDLESTMTYRLRDFMRINHPTFLVSKVGVHRQKLIDGVYKVLSQIGVTFKVKVELYAFQLRVVSEVWFT